MEELKSHLKEFARKAMTIDAFAVELSRCLDRNPEHKQQIRGIISGLADRNVFSPEEHAQLDGVIDNHGVEQPEFQESRQENEDATRVQVRRPAAPPPQEDTTRVQPRRKAPEPEADSDATRVQARPENPPDIDEGNEDKTSVRARRKPPPRQEQNDATQVKPRRRAAQEDLTSKRATFQELVKQFVADEVSYEVLEAGLVLDLEENPDKIDRYATALGVLEKQQLVADDVTSRLRQTLDAIADGSYGGSVVPDDDDDEEEGGSDRTQIFGGKRDTQAGRRDRTSRAGGTGTTGGTSSMWNKPFQETEETQVRVGSILNNRFKLVEFVGYGGMGDVYKAEDLLRVEANDADSEVAVKVLNKEFRNHPDSLRSLQREARKTQDLAHPHIVNVFDFQRDEEQVFMTMELMRGKDLSDILKKSPDGLPLDVAKRYIQEMSDALAYAHRRNVIHSDFKPGNIFVDDGEIKILDFGIAREGGGGAKKDTFDAGDLGALTPSYASLEMLEDGTDPDPRDDIYALGCISYELITGKHPFRVGKKKIPANQAKLDKMKPERIPQLKSWQWKALASTLEFDRADRVDNVGDFIEDFMLESRPLDPKILVGGVSLLVGGVAGLFFLPQFLEQREVDQFKDMVEEGQSHDQIMAAINDIEARGKSEEFLESGGMDDVVLPYLTDHVQSLVASDDFVEAESTVTAINRIYSRTEAIREDFDEKRNERINQLNTDFNEVMASENFDQTYPELNRIVSTFRRVDEEYPQKSAAQLAMLKLTDTANSLMRDQKYSDAQQMTDFALSLFEGDERIAEEYSSAVALKESIGSALQRLEKEDEIEMLASSLQSLPDNADIPELGSVADDAGRLYLIDPANKDLLGYQARLKNSLANEIDRRISNQDWDESLVLLDRFEQALPATDIGTLKSTIRDAQAGFDTRLDELTRGIARITRSDDPGEALPLLRELQGLNVNPQLITDAENQVASGWQRQSRISAARNQYDDARNYINRALEVTSDTELQAELRSDLARIDDFQSQATQQVAAAEASEREQERLDRIADLETRLAQAARNNTLSGSDSRQVLDLFDRLELEDPGNATLSTARETLLQRYLTESNRLANGGDVTGAVALVNDGINIFPNAASLTGRLDSLRDRMAEQRVAQKQEQINRLETRLESLVASFNPASDTEGLLVALKEYEALQEGQNVFSQDIRFQAANAWVSEAEALKDRNRFDDALAALSRAKAVDRSHGRIAGLESAIADAANQARAETDRKVQLARIDSAKQSFVTQMRARDVTSAGNTLSQLRSQIPDRNDPFWQTTVPNEAEAAYVDLASRITNPSGLDQAVDYIKAGLEFKPSSAQLQTLLKQYEKAQLIVATTSVNASQAQQLLNQAKFEFPNAEIFQKLGDSVAAAASTATPAATGRECVLGMKNLGSRRGAWCFDQIGEVTGPRLVVVDGVNGPMAIMRYEMRVGDYNNYCQLTGNCTPSSADENLPMTGLSISEVTQYLNWLSSETGKEYRIPTIEEWRVAASAGGQLQADRNCVSFGGTRGKEMQQINAWREHGENGWGLAHTNGNAQELVIDGSSYLVAGGAYTDNNADCNPQMAKAADDADGQLTGYRFVRNL